MRVPLPHRDSINVMQGSFSYYINVVLRLASLSIANCWSGDQLAESCT